jgi:ribonuclease/clavin/mitogillin
VVPAGAVKLAEYKKHRLLRESMVLAALKAEPQTAAQLVPAAYPEISHDLYPLAERSLLAHALKLVKDGKAIETEGAFALGR